MSVDTAAMNADPAIWQCHVDIAEEAIADLQRRITAWRPPDRERQRPSAYRGGQGAA